MAVGDVTPIAFDFGQYWTDASDPVISASVVTSSQTGLPVLGTAGVQDSVVTARLNARAAGTDYAIACRVQTASGKIATRTANVFVDA